MTYDKTVLQCFLKEQGRLFPQPVAETEEEADAFLSDCMATVCDSLGEVREVLDESGMDVCRMTEEDLLAAAEVFALPDHRYLIVEG